MSPAPFEAQSVVITSEPAVAPVAAETVAVDNIKSGSDEPLIMNWPMVVYLGLVHVLGVYCVYLVVDSPSSFKGATYGLAFVLWIITGLGITAGAHRLWAHRSYKAGIPLRCFLMICNSIANQGSVIHWVRDHRTHHIHSDTGSDPHDSNRGWFYSHCGWLLVRKPSAVYASGGKISLVDVMGDSILMFQRRLCPWWNLAWCFLFPAVLASYCWGESFKNGFLLAGVFRYCFVLHATWAVNSVVHRWGPKPYDQESMTTENPFVAFFALGEGWHNWHHAFDWDYATAEMGASSQYNPTKMFIDAMCFIGFAWGRRRANPKGWEHMKERHLRALGPDYVVVESQAGIPLFRYRVTDYIRKADLDAKHLRSE